MIEKGLLPDVLLRFGMRRLLAQKLIDEQIAKEEDLENDLSDEVEVDIDDESDFSISDNSKNPMTAIEGIKVKK